VLNNPFSIAVLIVPHGDQHFDAALVNLSEFQGKPIGHYLGGLPYGYFEDAPRLRGSRFAFGDEHNAEILP
jgi:hypothetical protein